MNNPFKIKWLKGWSFKIVFLGGNVSLEAHGFGACLKTTLTPGESPKVVADKLVFAEDQRRRALYRAWVKDKSREYVSPIFLVGKENDSIKEGTALITHLPK